MNLHAVAGPVIASINPMVAATLKRCLSYSTSASGRQTPNYAAPVTVQAQVQDLSQRDLMHLSSLNVQGSQKVVYISGLLSAVNRPNAKGGDLVTLPDGVWLTTSVLESWPDWCRVSVTQQMNGS